ncbi:hypothetical protein QOZ80_5BG0442100 [Eleusine coracana subsp. coracana]|nr:hypothetical protein QOZ80_5BG0442100 [Eleusine coracana subsp. coracana]
MTYYPNGTSWVVDDYVSLYLDYASRRQTELLAFRFSLLNQARNPVPERTRSKTICIFCGEFPRKGFHDFSSVKDLEEFGCLAEGNRFAVQCDITVVREWAENNESKTSNIKGENATAFDVHGWLLAAWSPVFEKELLAVAKEKASSSSGGGVRRHMEVRDMDRNVFKAMLHFMYTDTLPPEIMGEEGKEGVEMTQGLLAAAHRYRLERLKLMCETARRCC